MNSPTPIREISSTPTTRPDRCPQKDMFGMSTCEGNDHKNSHTSSHATGSQILYLYQSEQDEGISLRWHAKHAEHRATCLHRMEGLNERVTEQYSRVSNSTGV